jgi:hypothetical protein
MAARPDKGWRRGARGLLAGSVLAAGVLAATRNLIHTERVLRHIGRSLQPTDAPLYTSNVYNDARCARKS